MLSKSVIFLIILAFYAFVLPRCICKVLSVVGSKVATATLQNMKDSLLKVTKERSSLHILEKLIVGVQAAMFYNLFSEFNEFYVMMLAILMIVETTLIVMNRNATSYCWVCSWHIKALRSDDRDRYNKDKRNYSKEERVYEESKSRQKLYGQEMSEYKQKVVANTEAPTEDLILKIRDVKRSVSAMTAKLQEIIVLQNVKNITSYEKLKGPAIFTDASAPKLIDVRLDNAINAGAVGILWQYVCPALMMDLNLLRIVKTNEIELFENTITWTNKPLTEIGKDLDQIEDKIMTMGIKLVKINLWFRNTCGHLNCMRLEFASSIIHKDYLIAKLHRLVEDLDVKAGVIDYRDTNAFFYELNCQPVEKEALDVMLSKQKVRDLICYNDRSRYKYPQILLQATIQHKDFDMGAVEKPLYADELTGQLVEQGVAQLIRVANTSNRTATCYTYLVDAYEAKDIYRRAVGCTVLEFQQFYRVTALREVLGVIINTNPEIKKNGIFAISIGDRSGADTWHVISFSVDDLKAFLEESDNAFFANLYFTARRDLFDIYNKVECMYILWDLTEIKKEAMKSTLISQHIDLCKGVIRADKLNKSKPIGIFSSDAPDTMVYSYQADYDVESTAWMDNLINDYPSMEVPGYNFKAEELVKELVESYRLWSKGSKLFNVFITVDKSIKKINIYGVSVIKMTSLEEFRADLVELFNETIFKESDNSKKFRIKLNYEV